MFIIYFLFKIWCVSAPIWADDNLTNNKSAIVTGGNKLLLPDTNSINGQLTANFQVDHFFSLWIVFHNDDIKVSDEPFTIFAPINNATKDHISYLRNSEHVKQLLLNHIILGTEIQLDREDQNFTSLAGRQIRVTKKQNKFYANDALILEPIKLNGGVIITLDSYVLGRVHLNNTQHPETLPVNLLANISGETRNETSTILENLQKVLLYFKDGVRVFQHFLAKSNITSLLKSDVEYTVLVPIDFAFQRWHPIDWGFYPFSVPEFTEYILRNHFIIGKYEQGKIKDGETVYTLGGNKLQFSLKPNLQIDGVTIAEGDTPFKGGNLMFINEVLFVTDSVVSRLHQQHKDKETPPLLAFPWFGAQFLSHAFLALEHDKRFTQITRFLNLADLAAHVSGTGYTFFVPTDKAFEEMGLNRKPDNYLSGGEGLKLLLNHFIKRRLYLKDFGDNSTLTTIGGSKIQISNEKGNITLNGAHIIEGEVFVYNLGTMYYMDKLLFSLPNNMNQSTTTSASRKPKNIEESSNHELIDAYQNPLLFKKINESNPIK